MTKLISGFNFEKHIYCLKNALYEISKPIRKIVFFGSNKYCPVCKSRLRGFVTTRGPVKRPDARCPVCWSLERHRIVWFFFRKETNLFSDQKKKMLHIAPELVFMPLLKKLPNLDYLSGDLSNPRADVKMDITKIDFPQNHFDVIYCSHVLEHVPDDIRAMEEFFRVLRPKGWALLLVPISSDVTIEDPFIIDPEERKRLFGHPDHVRRYGLDFRDRLEKAGFDVKLVTPEDLIDKRDLERMGVTLSEKLFFCRKNTD